MKENEPVFRRKMIFTAAVIFLYLIGRELPLYGIDRNWYLGADTDAQAILLLTVSGDVNRCSLFALGIGPYMTVSIIVQVALALQSYEKRSRISPAKTGRLMVGGTFVWAVIQAILRCDQLVFRENGRALSVARSVACMEMVAGTMIILWLCDRNKKYGLGGQTPLIFVNIIDSILQSLRGHSSRELLVPLVLSLGVMMVMLMMENTQIHIPVQRISIHNIYADKDYLAFKLNPIGVMPVMYSAAFFMVPQIAVQILEKFFPENETVEYLAGNLVLTRIPGVILYLFILYFLTILFSLVFLDPSDITEQFLKSGDSIVNLHAGRDTKRYLTGVVLRTGICSATVMAVCVGTPLLLQLVGGMDSALVMLPSSCMMLVGIWCNLYQDGLAIRELDAYRPFI
jgi:preprotein translocase subunit SecY